MTEPRTTACTRESTDVELIGAGCPDCGHTNVVHPHRHANPSLRSCQLCEIALVLPHNQPTKEDVQGRTA